MKDSLQYIRTSLEHLEEKLKHASLQPSLLKQIHTQNKLTAQNLLQYLTLRNHDIREVQDLLHEKGLSSLASSESHIHRQVQEILLRIGITLSTSELNHCTFSYGRKKIFHRSVQLFGHSSRQQHAAIMVTLDKSYLTEPELIKHLLKRGMNTARINCAHDNEAVWIEMIQLVRKSSRLCKLPCSIYMDLAGPKIRTVIPAEANGKIKVEEGETIYLNETNTGETKHRKTITCTHKGIVPQLRKNNLVMFDDGIIEAVVKNVTDEYAELTITRVPGKKAAIKAEKGLNFPDALLNINPVTAYDKSVLPFVTKNADLIGCSFIRSAEDVKKFQKLIRTQSKTATKPFLIYKIETPEAVLNLPEILFQGLTEQNFGVMIARGDLAVEIGFERMSEIQEEILWICEAAHTPVIWATQVLETLNKTGMATRSEITDAFRSSQAECVMLNKGAYILNAIEALNDILTRSGGHHIKKRYTFRPLKIAENYFKKN
jgi:pyruvate kinase